MEVKVNQYRIRWDDRGPKPDRGKNKRTNGYVSEAIIYEEEFLEVTVDNNITFYLNNGLSEECKIFKEHTHEYEKTVLQHIKTKPYHKTFNDTRFEWVRREILYLWR